MTANALVIEVWPIDRLRPYPRNPRKNDCAIDRMCESIRQFGFKIPCLVRSDGEIVDGHLRLKAVVSVWPRVRFFRYDGSAGPQPLPVAFISSFEVAPPGRFGSSRILAALLPSRAEAPFFWDGRVLGAFLAGLAFFSDFALFGATFARFLPTRAVLVAFGSAAVLAGAVSICSVFAIMCSPLAVTTAVTT